MAYYTEREMALTYAPAEIMRFAKGSTIMTPETAERLTWGLVTKDRQTGRYRRACPDTGSERAIIAEAKEAERLRAGAVAGPSAWSARRP